MTWCSVSCINWVGDDGNAFWGNNSVTGFPEITLNKKKPKLKIWSSTDAVRLKFMTCWTERFQQSYIKWSIVFYLVNSICLESVGGGILNYFIPSNIMLLVAIFDYFWIFSNVLSLCGYVVRSMTSLHVPKIGWICTMWLFKQTLLKSSSPLWTRMKIITLHLEWEQNGGDFIGILSIVRFLLLPFNTQVAYVTMMIFYTFIVSILSLLNRKFVTRHLTL